MENGLFVTIVLAFLLIPTLSFAADGFVCNGCSDMSPLLKQIRIRLLGKFISGVSASFLAVVHDCGLIEGA